MDSYPHEYDRERNLNTVEYWDNCWKASPDGGESKAPIRNRIMEWLEGLPKQRIYEYGFGNLFFARLVGKDRWVGRDFSPVAVERAKAEGYTAHLQRCRDADGWRRSYLVAIEVLEHLDREEMFTFLERSQNAPHAFFSVPVESVPDRRFKQHQRGFGHVKEFGEWLKRWWPYVDVEQIGKWMAAHCMKQPPEKEPILTVGSSTLLDFHGVTYTFGSLMTHHGNFGGDVEFLLVDNHPEPTTRCRGVRGFYCEGCRKIGEDGPECKECAKALADMQVCANAEGARYVRWSEKQGTYPGKDRLKVEARGKWVLCMDSHVMLTPHALEVVLETIEENPESDDFYHFPNLFRSANPDRPGRPAASDYRNQQFIYHGGAKRGGVYGWTGEAKKPGRAYPIAAMITSCYLVRKKAWFSARGYDPILGNYGGWEGPLQLKWWLMGRQVRSLRYRLKRHLDQHDFLHHWHMFNHFKRLSNATGHVHSGKAKMRNFAASSAVIGGESWVRRHCELKGWNFEDESVQEGLREGMKLRPWMVENLARPEWEDITEFFRWMRDEEKVPGALKEW